MSVEFYVPFSPNYGVQSVSASSGWQYGGASWTGSGYNILFTHAGLAPYGSGASNTSIGAPWAHEIVFNGGSGGPIGSYVDINVTADHATGTGDTVSVTT